MWITKRNNKYKIDDGCVVINTPDTLRDLQNLTSKFATLLGNTQDLFGMELAGNAWTDSAGADDSYYPKNKKLSDFSEEECIKTLNHIHDSLLFEIGQKEQNIKDLRDIVEYLKGK